MTKSLNIKYPCPRCGYRRYLSGAIDPDKLCTDCGRVRARHRGAPNAACLVCIHKIERWFGYDRLSRAT